jgi:flap endonuclease-1
MGIRGLTALIKDNAPDAIETSQLYKLKGKVIGIDASGLIYKSLMVIRQHGKVLTNGQYPTSHIVGVFNKTCSLLSYGITPVFIFDGKPPLEKGAVIKERNDKAQAAKDKLCNSPTLSNKASENLQKQTIRLRKYHTDDIKRLLDLLGVKWIHAEGEAEGVAAELCRIGLLDYVMSEDMDTLAFGTPKLIRNCIDKTIKRTSDIISIFSLDKVLEGFGLNYNEFLELCVLSGCDYCDTLKRVGNKTAIKLMREHRGITKVLEVVNDNKIPEGFRGRFDRSIELFNLYRGYNDTRDIKIVLKPINYNGLLQYLVTENKMDETRILANIKKINSVKM